MSYLLSGCHKPGQKIWLFGADIESTYSYCITLANGTLRTVYHNLNLYYLLCDTITCFNFKSQQFQNYWYSHNEVNNFTDVMIIIYPGLSK